MPVYRIPERHIFPDPEKADESGLLGVGGDLDPARLLLAYSMGVFPWYSEDQPILWWSPEPRYVLHVDELHVGRSLRKRLRRADYRITMDTAFEAVIDACSWKPRPGQNGTWITDEMMRGYVRLHQLGFAHSVEAWHGEELVGGLYGVALGRLYCGESMFTNAPDASKVAFVHLVRQLERWGYPLVDCQLHTEHLERFGARDMPRSEYLMHVAMRVREPGRTGRWAFDDEFAWEG